MTEADGTILSANPSACRMFGRTEDELCEVGWSRLVDSDAPETLVAVQKSGEKENFFNTEAALVRKDGTKFPVEVTVNHFKDNNGFLLSSIIIRDITDRKKAEEALHFSMEKFTKAFYNCQAGIAITRLKDNKYINVNKHYSEILGYACEELKGKNALELNSWVDLNDSQVILEQIREQGYVRDYEGKFRRKSGEIRFALLNGSFLELDGEKCLLTSIVDITERKKAEEALRLSKEAFYKAFNANPMSMTIVSLSDGIILEVNETSLKKTGYTKKELIGVCMKDLNPWLDLCDFKKFIGGILEKGFVKNLEVKFRSKSGYKLTVLLSGVIINLNDRECILGIANDITELRRYQNEMARLDRLNLIGEMAAGIGHEVRNPMTTVKGFLQLLKGRDKFVQEKEYFDLMIFELDRANSIITEFLSLAKDKAVELKKHCLNKTIKTFSPLLQADALKQDKNIEMELGDIPEIVIDVNEIHQLIVNLVLNGLDAMSPGGSLTIKTFKENDQVVLAVQDRGRGIAPEILEKIGTPFFTTKDHGTGLGLAVCYSIAQRHKARIDVETSKDGTTFMVRFKL